MSKLRVGLLGANWAARGHLPGWRMLPDQAEVVAVCTTRPETALNAASRLGLALAYHDFQAMLEDGQVDIVSLGGPPPVRHECTLQALRQGKHVFTCIPFAVTLEQAREMAQLQTAQHLTGAVDAYFGWTPGFSFAKDLIEEGVLGELYAVNVDFSMAQFVLPKADYPYRWTGLARNGTGVVPNSCSHVFHLLLHLFGSVKEVIGQSKIAKRVWEFDDGSTQVPEVPDTAVLLARLANGALVNVHAGRSVPSATGLHLSAYGSKGRLTVRSPAYPLDRSVSLTVSKPVRLFEKQEEDVTIPECYFRVPGGRVPRPGDAPVALSLGRLFSQMIEAIHRRDPALAYPNFQHGLTVQSIVDAVQRSEISRCWETIKPEGHI